MPERTPLGIHDLHEAVRLRYTPYAPAVGDCWYWCRLHERTEQWVDATSRECKRIGPFMSEREANRLGEVIADGGPGWGEYVVRAPLGMEVET